MVKKIWGGLKKSFSFYNDTLKDIILKKVDNRYLNFSSSLVVFGSSKQERCLYLDEDNSLPVWGIEIATDGNETLIVDNLQSILSNHAYSSTSKMLLVCSKRPVEGGFCFKESIYLFSFNKRLLEDISFSFEVELMEVDKLYQALYDMGQINEYRIDKEHLSLKSNFHNTSMPQDELNNLYFKTVFAEGVYGAISKNENPRERNYCLYQGIALGGRLSKETPNFYRLFREKWQGYISFYIDIERDSVIKTIEDTTSLVAFGDKSDFVRKEYNNAKDEAEKIAEISSVWNIVALIDNKEAIPNISSILDVQFVPKNIGAKNIIYGTPLLERAKAYDFISPNVNISGILKRVHKKHNLVSRTPKHMWGRDVSYNFVNYSFSETGDSLHWAIVAPTRSGKTFKILKTIQSIIKAEIEAKSDGEIAVNKKLVEEKGEVMVTEKVVTAPKLGKNKIIHFDTGNSGLAFVTELKRRYPSKVFLSRENINFMRFGLFNIRYDENRGVINEDDFSFSVSIMNLILSLSSTNEDSTLSGSEIAELRKAVSRVFQKDDYRGLMIKDLEKIGGYEEAIKEIYAYCRKNGIEVSSRSRVRELKLKGTELDYMQKPTFTPVMKEIERKGDNYTQKTAEKEACSSLYIKLSTIENQPMFAHYDRGNIAMSDYYYMELSELKELGEKFFLPAYMITLQRLYRRDVNMAQKLKDEGKSVPSKFYIMEEAHNFLKIPAISTMFEVMTREASRYHIYLGFITQMANDIPLSVLPNIGTRMVLSSNRVTRSNLSYFWASDNTDKEEVDKFSEFYAKNKRRYLTFINSGNGIVTMQQSVSSSEERIFNSNGEADIAEEIEADNVA